MKRILLFLCLWIILSCTGCRNNEDSRIIEKDDVMNMEISPNTNVANENVPTEDIDSINKTSTLIIKDEVANDNLVTTNVDILSSSKLLITYTNKTSNVLMYGNDVILQRLEDDWIDIPALPNVGWKDIAMNLNPEESFDCTVDLKQLFGEQEKGQYRIIKNMTTDSTTINVIVEFNIE